jgi:hypothetical protein
VTLRRVTVTVLVVLGMLVLLVAAYLVGERGCPPPSWAFWRFTEGAGGRTNFACVAGG